MHFHAPRVRDSRESCKRNAPIQCNRQISTSYHLLIFSSHEQRVNPKLTLPYWDFTIEEAEAANSGENNKIVIDSPLFQDSWFGTADPNDHTVSEKSFSHRWTIMLWAYVVTVPPWMNADLNRSLRGTAQAFR